jgi:anti-anti-sigma factor
MDSSGINALVMAHHSAVEQGRHVYVTNAEGIVAQLLDLTGIGELMRPPAESG